MKNILQFCIIVLLTISCSKKVQVDLIVHNANIYTVDESFTIAEAMAIQGDQIVEVGPEHQILNKYSGKEIIDAGKKTIYPGLIDAHCHFIGYAKNSALLNLVGVKNEAEMFEKLDAYVKESNTDWIQGRGWDQNLWESKSYPNNEYLNSNFPSHYIILKRVDGHAALVNQKVLDLAGITASSKIDGGEVIVDGNRCTGILIDNAVEMVEKLIPKISKETFQVLLEQAQQKCFEKGITTVSDAGLDLSDVEMIDEFQQRGILKIKIYAMLNPTEENFNRYLSSGPVNRDGLSINSFKFYADGALGSRGACLLKPYSDRDQHRGLLLASVEELTKRAQQLYDAGFQMNTHAIGDSAVRNMLNIYAGVLGTTNDRRWRVEHAQVVSPEDLVQFKNFNIIPSVQPTHATSDMDWAGVRLGKERIKHAYAYKSLKDQNGMIAFGTDFPVESIDPLLTLLAGMHRKNNAGLPVDGFQIEQALSFEDCLRGMTIWAAIANFEEEQKGSLTAGKKADFVIFNRDLKLLNADNLIEYKVDATYVNGLRVY